MNNILHLLDNCTFRSPDVPAIRAQEQPSRATAAPWPSGGKRSLCRAGHGAVCPVPAQHRAVLGQRRQEKPRWLPRQLPTLGTLLPPTRLPGHPPGSTLRSSPGSGEELLASPLRERRPTPSVKRLVLSAAPGFGAFAVPATRTVPHPPQQQPP